MLSRLLSRGGNFATPTWKAQQIDVPEVDAQPMPPKAPNAPPSVPISQHNGGPTNYSAPSIPALGGLGLFPPAPATPMDWLQGAQFKNPTEPPAAPVSPPVAAPAAPLPAPRPAEAPAPTPDTGFFMRNALMMQDPNGGGFIDPMGAASVRGPDLIQKMMGYLHNKV